MNNICTFKYYAFVYTSSILSVKIKDDWLVSFNFANVLIVFTIKIKAKVITPKRFIVIDI